MREHTMAEPLDAMKRKIEEHFAQVDETVLVVLKGHLLIEEALDTIISRFVFHPEFIQAANLRFAQKLSIARSISLDEHNNEMWGLEVSTACATNWRTPCTRRNARQEYKLSSISISG
jgi:hypothetical protein